MDFTSRLEVAGIRMSMDGRGRALDNVFVECRWRTVKDEEVYLTRLWPFSPNEIAGKWLPDEGFMAAV